MMKITGLDVKPGTYHVAMTMERMMMMMIHLMIMTENADESVIRDITAATVWLQY